MKIQHIKRPFGPDISSSHRHNNRKDREFNYQSPMWRRTTKAFLQANPYCDECGAKATLSDHFVRIKDGGDPYAWSNLRPKCDSCHNKKDNNKGR